MSTEVEMTIRLSDEAFSHLRRAATTYGLSNRAMFETAVRHCLEVPDRVERGELGALYHRVYEAAWEVARRIDTEARFGDRQPRRKVGIRLEDVVVDRLRELCTQYGVSMNSRLAAVVAPWGTDWGRPRHLAARARLWEETVAEARRISGIRRYGAG